MLKQVPEWIVFIIFLDWLAKLEDGFDQYNMTFTKQTRFPITTMLTPLGVQDLNYMKYNKSYGGLKRKNLW